MNIEREKTDFGPGKTALYYNNHGLFSDPFLEERLPKLEDYYNHPSTNFLNGYWNIDESDASKFNKAFQGLMDLWNDLDQDVPKFCTNERQLQNRWIDRVFEILGWTIELEESSSKHGITNYPDYALFASSDDWKKSKSLSGNHKFKKAIAVADAKGWGINLDGKGFSNKNPSFQIINYLKQTDKNWGVLTDGKYWRIYSLKSESKHTTYYEVDLEKILAANDYERFKYFYNFFRVEAFIVDSRLDDRSFLDFVFDDGKFYSQRIESNLQARVYKVVESIALGFIESRGTGDLVELREIYDNSMYYVFKLMFVLNCESRGLLEVNKQDDYYEYSVRKLCFQLKEQLESGKNWSNQPGTYNYIMNLFNLLREGDASIGVHGFGSEPFSIGTKQIFESNKIADRLLNQALLDLACDLDEEGNFQFIDYKILSPEHIGSIFEGLLEFSLVKNGREYFLENNKGERKSTGSYYTPSYLVDYVVEKTLRNLAQNKSPKEILKLKVLDPAMGSGHFLIGVIKYLEKEIQEIQDRSEGGDHLDFGDLKKLIAHNCIFGVDINPLAVELAKFSVWIYTAQKGDCLEPLNDQFICGNSLLDDFNWTSLFQGQIGVGAIDAIVGNPPYIGEKGNTRLFRPVKESSVGRKFYKAKMDYFYFFFHRGLDILKDNGYLSFVTTNYFCTATGGSLLREDLRSRANLYEIINFNEAKVFKGAGGQHNQVTFLQKGTRQGKCKLVYFNSAGTIDYTKVDKDTFVIEYDGAISEVSPDNLFYGKEDYITISFLPGEADEQFRIVEKIKKKGELITKYGEVYQGIVSGADRVTDKILAENPRGKWSKNDGIFILTLEEVRSLGLSPIEKKVLKPFYKNSDIDRWGTSIKTLKFILFIDKDETESSIKTKYPNIYAHLLKYKKMLIAKREKLGERVDKWFTLNRGTAHPEIFTGHKIVAPQRSSRNTFGYNNVPWYASADVYYIIPKQQNKVLSFALLGILNSKLYYFWLLTQGKRKGNSLELYRKPLSEIIVPKLSGEICRDIAQNVTQLLKTSDVKYWEAINDLISTYFELDANEIEFVSNMCPQNLNELLLNVEAADSYESISSEKKLVNS